MSQTYAARRRAESGPAAQDAPRTGVPGPSMQELAAGAAPSREQMGRRVDLPEAIREKMEASFGADFSNVKLYESRTVADAGADAMAMGGAVGFAPGKLDFTSTAGQAMLGHELSHVVSQARGEVRGSGFLADAALEARADREGALAAGGESVYAGPVTPLSASAIPAAAAGVAQASGKADARNAGEEARRNGEELPSRLHPIRRSRAKRRWLNARDDRLRMEAEKKQQAQDVLKATEQRAVAYKDASLKEERRFNLENPDEAKTNTMTNYAQRYLESGLMDLPEEERPKMYAAFRRGNRDAMLPYVASHIQKFLRVDSKDIGKLISEDEDVMMEGLREHSLDYMNAVNIHGLLKNMTNDMGLTPEMLEQHGLSREDMEQFDQDTTSVGEAVQLAEQVARCRDMMGTEDEEIGTALRAGLEEHLIKLREQERNRR